MIPSDLPVQAALDAWAKSAIAPDVFMRALVTHVWEVPVSDEAAREAFASHTMPRLPVSDDNGVKRLAVFSSGEAFRAYHQAAGDDRGRVLVTHPGTALFSPASFDIDAVHIDPGSAHAVAFSREQVKLLAIIGQAVAVERALVHLKAGQGAIEGLVADLRTIAAYPAFMLALRDAGGRPVLALAPNDAGRNLATVFTAQDAAVRYAHRARESGIEISTMPMSGVELCQQLKGMPLDGLVFNCLGPGGLVAFAPGLTSAVLDAAGA